MGGTGAIVKALFIMKNFSDAAARPVTRPARLSRGGPLCGSIAEAEIMTTGRENSPFPKGFSSDGALHFGGYQFR